MRRSVSGCVSALALVVALVAGSPAAEAGDRRAFAAGVIGGMSANAILGGYPYYPSYPGYGYGYYPGYPAPAYYSAPLGPPPGCVIRRQRLWDGYRWRWRTLRICH